MEERNVAVMKTLTFISMLGRRGDLNFFFLIIYLIFSLKF